MEATVGKYTLSHKLKIKKHVITPILNIDRGDIRYVIAKLKTRPHSHKLEVMFRKGNEYLRNKYKKG